MTPWSTESSFTSCSRVTYLWRCEPPDPPHCRTGATDRLRERNLDVGQAASGRRQRDAASPDRAGPPTSGTRPDAIATLRHRLLAVPGRLINHARLDPATTHRPPCPTCSPSYAPSPSHLKPGTSTEPLVPGRPSGQATTSAAKGDGSDAMRCRARWSRSTSARSPTARTAAIEATRHGRMMLDRAQATGQDVHCTDRLVQKSAFDLEFSVAIGGSRCPRRESGDRPATR
jgi:hypothetical protein